MQMNLFQQLLRYKKNGPDLKMIENAHKSIMDIYNSGWLIKQFKELYDKE